MQGDLEQGGGRDADLLEGVAQVPGQHVARVLDGGAHVLVAGRRAAHERVERRVVVVHELDEPVEGVAEALARRQLGPGLRGVQHRVAGRADDGGVQALPVAEVVVDEPGGDAGLRGQVLDGDGLQGPVGQRGDPERDELLPAFVGAHPGASRGCHAPSIWPFHEVTAPPGG